MLQILEQRDLPYSCTGDTIIFFFQSDLLNCDCLSRFQVDRFVNYTVCTFSELLKLFVLLKTLNRLDHLTIDTAANLLAAPLIL